MLFLDQHLFSHLQDNILLMPVYINTDFKNPIAVFLQACYVEFFHDTLLGVSEKNESCSTKFEITKLTDFLFT